MFSFTDIQQYHRDLKNRNTSCIEAVEHYIEVISKNEHLNAFVEVYASEAIKRAKGLDEKRNRQLPIGKLHGVVIALKDVICYKDHKVTAAASILKDFTSLYNASAVQFLIDEEAIIIGNCNCDEFAMGSSNENSAYGVVKNPIDNAKVPGGSSGGSAVAVSAGMCMVSLGSDTGGSVRQPADFCGIVGFKPTYGRISRYGLIAYASSFDQIGIFGTNISDVSDVLNVVSRTDEYDSTMLQHHTEFNQILSQEKAAKKFRIGYMKDVMEHPMLDHEIKTAIINKLNGLEEEGHEIIPIDFDLIDYVVPTYYVLTAAEASSNLSRFDGIRFGHQSNSPALHLNDFYIKNRSEGFGKEVKRRIMLGNFVLSSGYFDAYYTKAQQVRKILTEKTEKIFSECDFILTPVSPTTAFNLNEKKKDPVSMYLADIFTVFANLTGIPAIAIPLFKHSNGMPFGIQLLAAKEYDEALLQFSNQIATQQKK
jgi:aspartyl-tRNA(Asn)/glutamyl-tRNA(Gln) amidotransferase subunit A